LPLLNYDSPGNVITYPGYMGGAASYTYDAENHLTQFSAPSGNFTYAYDGDGKRVVKSSSASGSIYWYGAGSDALIETDLSNNNQAVYEYFNGRRAARILPSNEVDFYITDHLGNTRRLSTPSGDNQSDFYPFGAERSYISTGNSTHYKFTGKERDSESGLDNFEARYFTSSMGRFMSPDPENISAILNSDDPQSWNGYMYARNNPLRYTDPEGLNYTICDANGQNCRDLTDKQYEQYLKDNPDIHPRGGNLYVYNQDRSETKVGTESYYNEKIGEALQRAGRMGQAGVNAAMVITAPNYLLIGGAHFFLSGQAITTLGITPRFVPWVATSPALTKLINWMYQEGDTLWDGTAGAVRHELTTGEGVGGVFHSQKAQDIIAGAQNLLQSGKLSAHDQQVARAIIQKLSDALAGK